MSQQEYQKVLAWSGEEADYQELLETMPQGIVLHEPDGKIFYANPAAARILGVSLDQLKGLDALDPRWHGVHEDGSPFPGDTHPASQVLKSRREIRGVIMGVFNPDQGGYRWIEIDAFPHFVGETQEIRRVMVVFSDISQRRQTEADLLETMRRLKRSQQIAMVGDWIWDITTDRFSASEEGLYLMGYPPDSHPAFQDVVSTMHPDDRGRARDVLQEALRTGQPYSVEFRIFRQDTGELRHLLSMGSVDRDDQDRPVRVIGINQDITDRKTAEEALRQTEEKYRLIFEYSPIGLLYFDASGAILACNDRFVTIIGSSRDKLIGLDMTRLPDQRVSAAVKKALDGEDGFFEGDYHSTTANKLTPLRALFAPAVKGGVQSGGIGIIEDISARKESELALKQSENRFRELVDLAVDGILLGDHAGHVIGANQAFCRLVGLDAAQVIGRHVRELPFDPEDLRLQPFRFDLLQQGQIVENQRTLIRPDGGRVDVEMRSKMMPDGTYQSIFRDITERKEAEADRARLQEQLLQAHKMESVGRLTGGVAHDFNNMLGVILGYTDMGLKKVAEDQPLAKYLREIRKAAERSSNLTRQLLAFAHKQTVAPKVLDLNLTVEGMLAMLERLIGEDIELVWMPGRRLWPVMIDPTQVDQILANLCVNARDAISGNGRITIETENRHIDEACSALYDEARVGDYVCLTVSDDGSGMDAETQSHLFEPFFTTKEMGRGTGLGLATIYGVVKQNNGFISVYSEPDQGSSLKIYLPRYRIRTDEQPPVEQTETFIGGQGTILLVEDEPAILEMTGLMLQELGYTVLTADTPGRAMATARHHPGEIDLLVTDVIMPEMNGRELARNLLTLYPGMKRLFMSGYTAEVIAHHGVLEQGVHFIQKPFNVEDLAAKVAEVIDGP